MGFLSKDKSSGTDVIHIECEEVMNISLAANLHTRLRESLGKGGEIELHAANVERIDAAVLQLFTAFFKAAAAKKVRARWIEPSDVVLRSAGLLGLTDKLNLTAG
ncbi:MAG: STAS domain-containing protein [Gammaproteobacteria bacterium]|nr:STAS domain-containing protein [Gammaproteobacteria bacterium]MDH5652934.1 STAS domain-containing protein [Gammaproteobacteria bacterium]